MEPEPAVVLTDVRDVPLSIDELVGAVLHPTCGAVCVFLGVVRDHDRGQPVTALDYEAHPSARERLSEVAAGVVSRTPGVRVAAVHRSGPLAIGEVAVVVAAAAAHREDAFRAARDLIDTLKAEVPIWKHQSFTHGGTEWVGLP